MIYRVFLLTAKRMFRGWEKRRNIWINEFLRRCARRVLDKHRPKVIAITGSYGKTMAKDFVAEILKKKYPNLLKTEGSQNFKGVPATILRIPLTSSYLRFIQRLPKILWEMWFSKSYPDLLILELGITHPGKLRRLVEFVKPKIGIVTGVGPSHLEFLRTQDQVAQEKSWLPRLLPKSGLAILNFDDSRVRAMAKKTRARVLFYGLSKGADMRGEDVKVSLEGISFKLIFRKLVKKITIPGLINKYHIYSILAACACGVALGVKMPNILRVLSKLQTIEGRGNLVPGIKDTIIIDDSYNSNPASCLAALENLKNLAPGRRKITILGDMLELGEYTKEGHRKVGRLASQTADYLVGVGPASKFIIDEAQKFGLSKEKTFWFENSDKVAQALPPKIKPKDIILVKGSHAMEMEKIVKSLEMDKLK